MDGLDSEWQRKGATLSEKTAQREFGLSQDEIVQAIRAGKLQCRRGSAHGNPFLRLLRREVEALVRKGRGVAYLTDQQAKAELARVDRELRRLVREVAALEERRAVLLQRVMPLSPPGRPPRHRPPRPAAPGPRPPTR